MMCLDSIPTSWDAITPEWMTEAVASRCPGARVGDVALVDASKGNNRRARFRLRYAAGSGPEYVFVKAEGDFREMHAKNGNLFNEPRLFASDVDLPVPHAKPFRVLMDCEALDWLVVMDDVVAKGGRPCDCETTLSPEQALDGVLGLARMHERYWGLSPTTPPELSWLGDWEPTPGFLDALQRGVAAGLVNTADVMPDPVRKFGERGLVGSLERAMRSFLQGEQTLLHGDAHVGNTYVLPDGAIGFLDWQVARRGNAAQDVGYFFVSALSVEDRRRHQRDLIKRYVEALGLAGQRRPTVEEVWTRYRASMAFALAVWLATASAARTQTAAGSRNLCQRYATAFVDLDTPAALAELGV